MTLTRNSYTAVLTHVNGEYSEVDKFYCNFLAGTEAEPSAPALPVTLYQNYPNPFNPVTSIRYYLERRGPVRLDVFDVSGRLIARLVQGERGEGHHVVQWNGCTDDGVPVSSGVYLSVISVRGRSVSRKMVLAR